MNAFNIQQCRYESDSWKRAAVFLQEENGHMLHRLSEILKAPAGGNLLEKAEYFQGRLIEEDNTVKILRKEIIELDNLLVKEVYSDGEIVGIVMQKYNRVKAEMEVTERNFRWLKADFNDYAKLVSPAQEDNP